MARYLKAPSLGGAVESYPYTFKMLKSDNPNVSFSKQKGMAQPTDPQLAEWGMFPVTEVPRPPYDLTKDISEVTPVWNGSEYVQTWTETDASAEDIAERQLDVDEQADKQAVKDDAFVQGFISMTPAELQTYLDGLDTNAKLKIHVERLTRMMHILARERLKQ